MAVRRHKEHTGDTGWEWREATVWEIRQSHTHKHKAHTQYNGQTDTGHSGWLKYRGEGRETRHR